MVHCTPLKVSSAPSDGTQCTVAKVHRVPSKVHSAPSDGALLTFATVHCVPSDGALLTFEGAPRTFATVHRAPSKSHCTPSRSWAAPTPCSSSLRSLRQINMQLKISLLLPFTVLSTGLLVASCSIDHVNSETLSVQHNQPTH